MNDLAKIFFGSFGSGKTYTAIKEACEFLGVENNNDSFIRMCNEKRLAFVQLNPNFGYENFVAGVDVSTDKKGKINYEIVDRIFSEICLEAIANKKLNYCIILDDLDRINVSCLFGELINAIEYRNERVTTSSGKSLVVPSNLLIIGTMNSLKQNDPDYAVFRRFKLQRVVAKKDIIENFYNGQDEQTIDHIIDLYEKINDFIGRNISPDYIDFEKEYYIGPAFYLKTLTCGDSPLKVVDAIINYTILPILRQYVTDGIMECTYQDISSFQQSLMPTSSENIDFESVAKKVTYNEEEKCWEEQAVLLSDTKQEYLQVLQQGSRGYKAELFRLVFEAVLFSNVLPTNILFNEIFNNTKLIKVSNLYANHKTRDLYAAFIAEKNVSEQFQYSTQGGKITCSVYATTTAGNKIKPQYIINGKQYVIASGFRDGGLNASLNLYEPTLQAPLYHFEFVYKLITSYYNILKRNFDNIGVKILKELAEIELTYFDLQIKSVRDWTKVLPKLSLLWIPSQESIYYTTNKIEELYQQINESTFVQLYERYISETHQECTLIPQIGVEDKVKNYKHTMDLLNIHQMILQGPPGTSKTFGAKEFIANRIREIEETSGENADLLSKNQLNEKYYSNTSKLEGSVYWDIVQFHPSYDYEDFVRGIDVRPSSSGIEYVTVNKTLGKIAELANRAENNEKEFYLIIDEINRANIASVFGELIYALEYRGNPVSTPYVVNGDSTISLPSNLYIIGTMNTADKSIGNIDYAIKRRFVFFNSLSDRNVVLKCANNEESSIEIKSYDIVAQIFKDYLNPEYNLDDVQLGHTYFLRENSEEAVNIERMLEKMHYQVIPILREYFKDGILESKDEISENEATAELMGIIENYSAFENVDDEISTWLHKYIF